MRNGHEVYGQTRSAEKARLLEAEEGEFFSDTWSTWFTDICYGSDSRCCGSRKARAMDQIRRDGRCRFVVSQLQLRLYNLNAYFSHQLLTVSAEATSGCSHNKCLQQSRVRRRKRAVPSRQSSHTSTAQVRLPHRPGSFISG